ncbi:MAG TPA: bifunctional phosphopantothenoylcysteine decarboxylase/phosphopantothenate--cysteine ligase CoaBC [Anaerolineales bacterium]|jgi:phosphopantothenoylcysteine decarboxylase/phosphopantothenate--cysteine ligase|nr:bifunctional phosphopantothenoylcysteine decarboxylase/phosphopantothenate--cysteine ligase CoaBC [Anaerolineales bacterium]
MNPISNKRITLGVTGSIACYKAADLASKLTQAGALVDVILTQSATQFITPLTFQSVTGRKAFVDADLWGDQGHVQHIGLGHATDLIVAAPLTANTMAKLAHGIADNLLTVTALAATCPLVIAPAMDGGMFSHPATQANLNTLVERGAVVVGPEAGHLASGMVGVGRMSEPTAILGVIRHTLAQGDVLEGRKIIVTAGGTQEPIDPVRFISNRSSGKQGYALAQAALDLGAQVTLISTPTGLPVPAGAELVQTDSAAEMLAAVQEHTRDADALLMAAAVADFRPADISAHKIKKEDTAPTLELSRTADILLEIGKQKQATGFPRLMIGFAAESEDLLANAQKKLKAKQLDLIAANDISAPDAGFGVDTNRITLLFPDGTQEPLPLIDKQEVADAILQKVAGLLNVN